MGQVRVLNSHTSSKRDSWWYLEQDDDGTLHVRYEDDDDPNDKWRMPINDFMMTGRSNAREILSKLIGRLFEEEK